MIRILFIFTAFTLAIAVPGRTALDLNKKNDTHEQGDTTDTRRLPFYRRDYTYFVEYDAFYKLHWDTSGGSWDAAFEACDDEEANLFYPKEDGEWTVVKQLVKKSGIVHNDTHVFLGIHDEFNLGQYITVDGELKKIVGQVPPSYISTDKMVADGQHCVLLNFETGIYKVDSCDSSHEVRPFVCKKVEENRRPCPTIDTNYVYEEVTKKCYKVHNRSKTWLAAMQTCFMEGGLLVTIDSERESDIIYDKLKTFVQYYIGFRRTHLGVDFYTVKGKNLKYSGYNNWSTYHRSDSLTNCGAIERYESKALYKAQNCGDRLPFLCEMEAKI